MIVIKQYQINKRQKFVCLCVCHYGPFGTLCGTKYRTYFSIRMLQPDAKRHDSIDRKRVFSKGGARGAEPPEPISQQC